MNFEVDLISVAKKYNYQINQIALIFFNFDTRTSAARIPGRFDENR
jgi:hypothetical protein